MAPNTVPGRTAIWRRGPQGLAATPQVIVGTIHSVKGGQADVVYLFPDLSQAGEAQYARGRAARDSVIRQFYVGATRAEAAVAAQVPDPAEDPGQIIFGKLADLWRREYVEKIAAGRPMVAAPTRAKYVAALENHILPKWKDARLASAKKAIY